MLIKRKLKKLVDNFAHQSVYFMVLPDDYHAILATDAYSFNTVICVFKINKLGTGCELILNSYMEGDYIFARAQVIFEVIFKNKLITGTNELAYDKDSGKVVAGEEAMSFIYFKGDLC